MALGKAGATTDIDTPFGQTNALATNQPHHHPTQRLHSVIDLPKDLTDRTSRIVDDKDRRFA